MYTLYIDTHNQSIVIVLYKEDNIIVKKEILANSNHSMTTMPVLIETIEQAQIDVHDLNRIVVVNGPGSFTGVRLGVTIAKTLSYTLNIPIKAVSSLWIKAVSLEHEEITIVEREKNGVFIGTFNKNNQLQGEYTYLRNIEFEQIENKEKYEENIVIDYKKIIVWVKNLKSENPHAVNPLYVKKIEVEK